MTDKPPSDLGWDFPCQEAIVAAPDHRSSAVQNPAYVAPRIEPLSESRRREMCAAAECSTGGIAATGS